MDNINKSLDLTNPAHNLVWKNRYNEIINDCYWNHLQHIRKESIQPLLDSGWCVEPNYPTKEEFINQIKTDDEFAKKWGVKISERKLSLEERFNLRYPGGKFSVFQENYPNTHKRNDPNGLLDAFDIPTKIITLEYKEEKVSYYE